MSFIADQQLEEIRSRADIVRIVGEKIPLKRAGRNLKGLCPFHSEKSPSFMVNPEKQIFHCFGCGEGGDVFSFLMKYEGIDFSGAVERLADLVGVILERASGKELEEIQRAKGEKELFFKINRAACRFFHESLVKGEGGKKAREYLEARQIRPEMIREALLGYAPVEGKALNRWLKEKNVPIEKAVELGLVRRGDHDEYDFFRNRLLFSIVSSDGKILGFSGRGLDDSVQPKYLNSPDSRIYHKSDSLLGIGMAKSAIREEDRVILVEGNFDMLRLHQEGIRNVVAPLGTALTEQQVRSLSRLTQNFVLLFDGDEAGVRASDRALEIFLPLGLSPKIVLLPAGEDPDSFVRKEGAAPLREMISVAPSLFDLKIVHIFKEAKGPQEKARAVKRIAELLAKLPGEIEKMMYLQMVAERCGLSEELLLREISPKMGGAQKRSNFVEESRDEKGRRHPPLERTVLEILLSSQVNPEILFGEIDVEDFTETQFGEIWRVLRKDYQGHGGIDVARILNDLETGPLRGLITELVMTGTRWREEGTKVASDCLRQLRVMRIKGRLKNLSDEIRRAETEHDLSRTKELMDQKNRLIKEITTLH